MKPLALGALMVVLLLTGNALRVLLDASEPKASDIAFIARHCAALTDTQRANIFGHVLVDGTWGGRWHIFGSLYT